MRFSMTHAVVILGAIGLSGAAGFAATTATPAPTDPSAQAAYRDIETTLGMVPGFFKAFPEVGIAGAWAEFKSVQLNPNTVLSGKTKELIGLAVASQIPCSYCIYFHTAAAKANGATDEETREAVASPYTKVLTPDTASAILRRPFSRVSDGGQMGRFEEWENRRRMRSRLLRLWLLTRQLSRRFLREVKGRTSRLPPIPFR